MLASSLSISSWMKTVWLCCVFFSLWGSPWKVTPQLIRAGTQQRKAACISRHLKCVSWRMIQNGSFHVVLPRLRLMMPETWNDSKSTSSFNSNWKQIYSLSSVSGGFWNWTHPLEFTQILKVHQGDCCNLSPHAPIKCWHTGAHTE